jgi:hypothetical protein
LIVNLYHYANQLPAQLVDREQDTPLCAAFKPNGLWVSPDTEDGWAAWSRDAGYRVDQLEERALVTLWPNAKVLRIEDEAGMLCLDEAYRRDLDGPLSNLGLLRIDWRKVADEYDGILIAPYQGWARLDRRFLWYYPWDCASGCIWRVRAIQKFEPEGVDG